MSPTCLFLSCLLLRRRTTHTSPATGRPVEAKNIRFETGESIIWPSPLGAHNWQNMSFNAKTGLLYLPTQILGTKHTKHPGPEGIIFQSQNAYKELRRMLVDGFLWAVVSLPARRFAWRRPARGKLRGSSGEVPGKDCSVALRA